MLSTLLKHEFSATWRVPVALEALLILLGIMGAVTIGYIPQAEDSMGTSILLFVFMALYYVGIIAANIVTIVYLVMRYYKNLYTSQGYLTFTLPVKTSSIITSKVITGSVWMLLAYICTILSILITLFGIISRVILSPSDFVSIMHEFQGTSDILNPGFILSVIFLIIVSALGTILSLYFCITVGQLWAKHKILGAVLCYAALYVVNQIISTVIMFTSGFFGMAAQSSSDADIFTQMYGNMAFTLGGIVLIECAIYYVACLLITKKKVNLD